MAQKDISTPLMAQYNKIKRKHPDAILLFRVGDFYETFGADAKKAADILGITLTRRANGSAAYVELAGFPYHAIDSYLPKLVRAGQRVAICDQLEDPKNAKKVVKRGITELVTPGVSLNDNVLDHKSNNYLACVHLEKNQGGVAFLDISTGEFLVAEGSMAYVNKLLNSFQPKEVLYEKNKKNEFLEHFGHKFYTYSLDDWVFIEDSAYGKLLNHFETSSLKGFGINNLSYAIIASGAILQYLDITHHENKPHIANISRIAEEKYVWLDQFTIRNLELFDSIHPDAKTLLDVLDETISPMGSRLLKKWMALPLKHHELINERHTIVEYFISKPVVKEKIEGHIKHIGDIERIISKVAVNRILPRELIQLAQALAAIDPIKSLCEESREPALQKIGEQLNPCRRIKNRIETEIQSNPPNAVNTGNIIADGVSKELDELREISKSAKDYIIQMQQKEIERTGISSLKVGYNNVFGYYIEVRNTHKEKVPEDWIRKQTLVNAERYITEELKQLESKILGAEEKIIEVEQKLFHELVIGVGEYVSPIQLNASLIAQIDCLLSFARIAQENNYVRPSISNAHSINIKQGRHPVIEQQLPIDEEYVANDIYLDKKEQQIIIVTSPNMAGKSALLRQTALITLMAQIGSYVPADKADIGIVDKIFTRVGASDNISLGESTFMVEMHEAASILNNLSDRSLVILDEIGRGTSTYDGISIAWAIVEYLHENPAMKAKTLFATHYHELNDMESLYSRIKNYNISVREVDNNVVFVRKLKRGGSEHSFGIHVARMAGIPKTIVNRANEILSKLEENHQRDSLKQSSTNNKPKHQDGYQLSIFQLEDPVLKQVRDQIKGLDINNLTPVEALNKLNEIKRLTGLY